MSWDEFSENLSTLGEVLERCSATERTASDLQAVLAFFRRSWKAEKKVDTKGVGIYLPPPKVKGLFPRLSCIDEAAINFTFILGDKFDSDHLPKIADFQVKVTGSLTSDNCIVQLEDHWRVDSHDFPNPPPREPHPYIHFQRGGHALEAFASQAYFVPGNDLPAMQKDFWKASMQSPGPRIPFPPHCPILAIDYVIGQHDGDVWNTLRSYPEYREVIRQSQVRLWNPFFDGLAKQSVRERWMGPIFI